MNEVLWKSNKSSKINQQNKTKTSKHHEKKKSYQKNPQKNPKQNSTTNCAAILWGKKIKKATKIKRPTSMR